MQPVAACLSEIGSEKEGVYLKIAIRRVGIRKNQYFSQMSGKDRTFLRKSAEYAILKRKNPHLLPRMRILMGEVMDLDLFMNETERRLVTFPYNREAAVTYAHMWAYRRNPAFYDFERIGGDCTNFASQCIYAGTGVMNYTPTYGWYYISPDDRAPAWTGVVYLYNFLTANRGVGPYGSAVGIGEVEPGDLVQLKLRHDYFDHTPVIVAVGSPPTPDNILVAAHSQDVDYRPLATYSYRDIRFIHIEGVRSDIHDREEPPENDFDPRFS